MWFVYMGRHNTVIVIHHLAQRGTWSISRQSTNWSNFTKLFETAEGGISEIEFYLGQTPGFTPRF